MRTEFVPILNKSIPPVIEVFKDKTLKKGEEIEQFIFLIGSRVEEVTTSIFAISKLLHPYKWAHVFIPLLPVNLIDIIKYHVLFMANEVYLNEVGHDPRINSETEKDFFLFYNNEIILLSFHLTIKLYSIYSSIHDDNKFIHNTWLLLPSSLLNIF